MPKSQSTVRPTSPGIPKTVCSKTLPHVRPCCSLVRANVARQAFKSRLLAAALRALSCAFPEQHTLTYFSNTGSPSRSSVNVCRGIVRPIAFMTAEVQLRLYNRSLHLLQKLQQGIVHEPGVPTAATN